MEEAHDPQPLAVMTTSDGLLRRFVLVAVGDVMVPEPNRSTLNAIILAARAGCVLERRIGVGGHWSTRHRHGDRVSCATVYRWIRYRLVIMACRDIEASPLGQSDLAFMPRSAFGSCMIFDA